MLFNFVIIEKIGSTYEYSEALPPNPQHLLFSVREAVTVINYMSHFDMFDYDTKKPDWNPWTYDFGSPRANKLVKHVENGALISPPPSAQELEITRRLLERMDQIASTESPIPNKVPRFKFTVDEFWFVTPRECKIISQRFRPMEKSGELCEYIYTTMTADSCWEYHFKCESVCELMSQWIAFNELAEFHGGYYIV